MFESSDRPGGMPALAPGFRIPSSVVASDVARIESLGVEIRCNHRVGETPEALLASGFSAVVVACGFGADAELAIEGIQTPGVMGALDLLARVAHGEGPDLGAHPVVIGGGNTAMDAARTAQRLTGKPSVVAYRRTRAEMPAEDDEIHELLLEGNRLEELCVPRRVLAENGWVAGLECLRAELGEPDADGRRRPVPVEDSEFVIEASAVILAIGQRPDTEFLDRSAIAVRSSDGGIDVQEMGETIVPHVYAGGDITRGPDIIIAACADGRNAAIDICSELGRPFRTPELPELNLSDDDARVLKALRVQRSEQQRPDVLDVPARKGFDSVEKTFMKDEAVAEAKRCLQCQLLCDKCVDVCPNRANVSIRVTPIECEVPRFERSGNGLREAGRESVRIHQERQILHIDEFCNECGNCETFCVHEGRPYKDKPRLFLVSNAFEAESDNAYRLEIDGMSCRTGGHTARLVEAADGGWTYAYRGARFTLSSDFAVVESDLADTASEVVSLRPAVVMGILYRAIRFGASYLPQSGIVEGRDA